MLEFVTELRIFFKIHRIAQLNFCILTSLIPVKNKNSKSLELKNTFISQILSALLTKIFYIPIAKDPNLNK